MALWDQLSQTARDTGALSGLEAVLRDVGVTTSSTDEPGPPPQRHITATWQPSDGKPLSLDPATGAFSLAAADSTTGTPLEFPDPTVSLDLRLDLDAPGGDPSGPFTARLTVPSAVFRAPFLSGARLDSTGMLEPDPEHPVVKFVLPRLSIEASYQDEGSGLQTTLVSASTAPAGADPADLYDFVRMEPGHAFIGPGSVVGFGFRTAALDLSGTSNPPGAARAMPADWQGLWLPEVRLFVQPTGMEGLAVSAGVDDLWIGIGEHAGVTGTFTADVVDRAASPALRIRFTDAAGRWYGAPDPATAASLPETTTVYADAGGGLAPMSYSIRVGTTTTAGDRATVTTPATGTVDVTATATDGLGRTVTRTVACSRRTTTPAGPPAGGQPALLAMTTTTGSRIRIVAQTATHVTLALEPEGGDVVWTWPGDSASAPTATVPVAAGGTVAVTATRTWSAGAPVTFDCYWIVNHPMPAEDGLGGSRTYAYSLNARNTSSRPALPDGSGFADGSARFQSPEVRARLEQLPAGTTFTVDGFASYDGIDTDEARRKNRELSERRMRGLKKIIEAMLPGVTVTEGTAHGGVGDERVRNINWHATAVATPPTATPETVSAVLTRPAAVPDLPAELDPQPERGPVPACFHRIGVLVEIVRNRFVRAEIHGEFDVQTAAEQRLAANSLGTLPPRTNPQDGVCTFLVRLRVDEARGRWDALAEFRAARADTDGLAKITRPAGGSAGLDALGAVAALAPLLAAATPPSPDAGEMVGLAVATGGISATGAAGVVQVQSVTLRGGEFRFVDGPEGTTAALLLDVETTLSIDLFIIRVRADKPLTARYQAVGLRSSWDTGPGGVEFVPVWMFDPTRGYSLDVPTGALVAKGPLGDLLQVLGFKVSRDNPVYVEAEVGIAADLGIVTVDTIGVRVRIDQRDDEPQLTAFGATVDVPGVLHGSGHLSLPPEGGIAGAIDLTLEPLSVRVAATVKIAKVADVTGVFVGVEVEFPMPIVLGSSGLGIFGVLGGVGVNFERVEDANLPAPALTWLQQQLAREFGVLDPHGWRAAPGRYAFAGGILLGTLEGGYIVHLKGIVILELPGPRLLLITKADVLQPPPALRGEDSATFLAVLDIDLARGTIMIGLVAEYRIPVLLEIRVPVTAFFPTTDLPGWYVDLGTWQQPATVKVFEIFEGVGYVMVHGRPFSPLPPALAGAGGGGLTIATGLHLQFVWGSTSARLYLKVAGGFDAIVSFQPFSFTGVIEISGELRLFIVSIGASAKLEVRSGQRLDASGEVVEENTHIKGEVCGHVDFFFFSVEGCVELELGDANVPDPEPEHLVKGVVLVSRSPALLEGTATDRAVDGKLGDARDLADPASVAPPPVPLDTIPAIRFDVAADASGLTVFGKAPLNDTALGATHWIRRGRRWWAYRVDSVELVGDLGPGGEKPSVWWTHGLDTDAHQGPALALLSWLPTATPKAVTYGEQLTTTVTEQWGTVCDPAAPPAPVLWTFDDQPAGPSPAGWTLSGTPWPDPPDTHRSTPVRADLRVTERWRCGDTAADALRGIDPARVIRDAVRCPSRDVPPGTAADPLGPWGEGQPGTPSRGAVLTGQAGLGALIDTLMQRTSLTDARASVVAQGWDPEVEGRGRMCAGALLQSPYDDGPEPIRRGSTDDETIVVTAWDERGFKPGELIDAVRFTQPGGLHRFRVLLLLDERGANTGELVVRSLDADGSTLIEQPVDDSWIVSSANPLPPEWVDGSGPWAAEVERAGRMAAVLRGVSQARLLSLVEVEVLDGTVTVEVGWSPERLEPGITPPVFYVVAAEGLLVSEATRADWDTTRVASAREALTTSLTQAPDDHALLVPGEEYTVNVTWSAASKESDTPPASGPTASDYATTRTQSFTFAAEARDRVPDRLEPWLVATSPGPKEAGTFCDEPVRIAFSNQAVTKLFAAYETELRAYLHAASGDHPKAPGQALAQPFPLASAQSLAASLTMYGPWETAVREVVDGLPCIPTVGERTDITVTTIPYRFEPSTEYLLDVERVPLGAPADARGVRVLRVPFTTSRFRDVAELADLFVAVPAEHRVVTDRAPLDSLDDQPAGPQLDAAFSAAGLGLPEVPRYPRVVVLWDDAPVAQPVAVVVEGNEELWRSRKMPVEMQAPLDSPDPTHKWWAARPDLWLLPERSTTPPAAGQPPSATARIVRGPGDTRLIAMLAPGSRGAQLRVDLRHRTDELSGGADTVVPAVRVDLVRPPWEPTPEEED